MELLLPHFSHLHAKWGFRILAIYSSSSSPICIVR